MAQPTSGDVHIDVALSNLSIGFKPKNFVADEVFPIIPVDKESDKYYIWTKDFWFRDGVRPRAPGGSYAEGGLELSNTSFFCDNVAESFPIPRETAQNQDAAIRLEESGAEWLAIQFALHREISLATAIMDASAWTSDTTLAGGSQWSDFANSDPIGDVQTGIQAVETLTGEVPNVMLIGKTVWDKLKTHPDIIDRFKHTTSAVPTTDMVAALLEIDRILVGRAVKNTAEEGANFVGAYIWPKNALLMKVMPGAGLMDPSAGKTFIWRRVSGLTTEISKVPEDLRKRDVLLGDQAFDQKVTAADSAYEIINAVA